MIEEPRMVRVRGITSCSTCASDISDAKEELMKATGRCLCGAVTFEAEGVELGMHVCHCWTCRRWAGGPTFASGVATVAFQGQANIGRFDSSTWAERGFCKRCGSSLFFRLKQTDQYIIHMGAFDSQVPFAVSSEIYIDEKPPGYDLAGAHPRLTGEEFMATLQER